MEKRFIVRDINSKPITALLYHALRREIITGYEGTDSCVVLKDQGVVTPPYVICSRCIYVRISSENYKPCVHEIL